MIPATDHGVGPVDAQFPGADGAFLGASEPGVVLLVNADGDVRRRTERKLIRAGFSVSTASSFEEGRRLLATIEPDLLIADVRLGAFNGLHLAAKSHLERPGMPVFITYPRPDPVTERDADRCGARFIVAPADNPEFVKQVQVAFNAATGAQQRAFR